MPESCGFRPRREGSCPSTPILFLTATSSSHRLPFLTSGGSAADSVVSKSADSVPCGAPLAARAASHPPDRRVDLWWSGKHACHGGNVQVLAAPDGWPLWTSPVRPGPRERHHCAVRPRRGATAAGRVDRRQRAGRPGYEGEQAMLTTPIQKVTGHSLTANERTVNLLHVETVIPSYQTGWFDARSP